jgi:hypothetical protein
MAMMLMRVASRILSPAPAHARRCNASVEYDVRDSLISSLGAESNLVSNVWHEVWLRFTRYISVNVDSPNRCAISAWNMVRLTTCDMASICDPPVTGSISVWKTIVELFTKLLSGFA